MINTRGLRFNTRGFTDILDITDRVNNEIQNSDINNGILTIFVTGSTAGVTTIEYEEGLIQDLKNMWERLIPHGLVYDHDERWGDGNGYSHVRASLLGASLTIPIVDKRLTLGTWQQIILVDFDNRARQREIILQIIGE